MKQIYTYVSLLAIILTGILPNRILLCLSAMHEASNNLKSCFQDQKLLIVIYIRNKLVLRKFRLLFGRNQSAGRVGFDPCGFFDQIAKIRFSYTMNATHKNHDFLPPSKA